MPLYCAAVAEKQVHGTYTQILRAFLLQAGRRQFKRDHYWLGLGEQGQLQVGGEREGFGGAAEKRGMESGEVDRQGGTHSPGRQHQATRFARLHVIIIIIIIIINHH